MITTEQAERALAILDRYVRVQEAIYELSVARVAHANETERANLAIREREAVASEQVANQPARVIADFRGDIKSDVTQRQAAPTAGKGES
jgi:hypothetical protein